MTNTQMELLLQKKITRLSSPRRNKYKLADLGGVLKSTVVLSDKQLKQARREFEKSWAEDNK